MRALLVLGLGLAACDGGGRLAASYATKLSPLAGCGTNPVYLVASDANDTTALILRITGDPIAALRGGTAAIDYDVDTSDALVLFVETGSHVASSYCGTTDPSVSSRYHGVAGQLALTLDAGPDPDLLHAALTGLVVHEEHGDDEVTSAALALAFPVTW